METTGTKTKTPALSTKAGLLSRGLKWLIKTGFTHEKAEGISFTLLEMELFGELVSLSAAHIQEGFDHTLVIPIHLWRFMYILTLRWDPAPEADIRDDDYNNHTVALTPEGKLHKRFIGWQGIGIYTGRLQSESESIRLFSVGAFPLFSIDTVSFRNENEEMAKVKLQFTYFSFSIQTGYDTRREQK